MSTIPASKDKAITLSDEEARLIKLLLDKEVFYLAAHRLEIGASEARSDELAEIKLRIERTKRLSTRLFELGVYL
jgi:hypothetical protein